MREAGELSSDVSPRTLKQTRLALSPATDVSPPPDPSDTEERERRRAVRMENLQRGRVRRNPLKTIWSASRRRLKAVVLFLLNFELYN